MNRRFTLIFIKYISVFLALSFLIVMTGLGLFTYYVLNVFTPSAETMTADDLIYVVEENNSSYTFSNQFKEELKENGYTAFIIDDNANPIYPKINHNIKDDIIENLPDVITLPYKKHEHFIMINENHNSNNPEISNLDEINTAHLIDSLYTHNYNSYEYYIEDGNLKFTESMTQQDYTYVDEFTDGDITIFKLIGIMFVAIPLLLIVLTIIMAVILTRKISRPLFFYADWLTQLADGLLYKPSSVHNRKKSQKMYKELDDAIEDLNTQLLTDKLYRNQIDYYRDKWLSQLSHDLKSPLTSIYGYAKVMSYFPDDQEKYILLISDKAKYMENLIDSLNSNFKLETSQMKVDKDMFSLTDTIQEIVGTVGYDNIKIINELDAERYYGNKLYIERMFINLIENSLDHNKTNPRIEIHLSDETDSICIHYQDNGIGMDNMSAESFMKHGATSKDNKGNHGIGFSVIKDAIEFHHGSFTVIPAETGVHFKIDLH